MKGQRKRNGTEEGKEYGRRVVESEKREIRRATHHECPHGCCRSLIWGLMLRGCLEASFYTGQSGPHSMPRPITYEMRRSYCKSLALFLCLFLSFPLSFLKLLFLLVRRVACASHKFVSVLSLKFIHSIRIGSSIILVCHIPHEFRWQTSVRKVLLHRTFYYECIIRLYLVAPLLCAMP